MANTRTNPTGPTPAHVRKRIWLLAAAFLLVEIAVLPGAASPFRTPKSVLAVAALLLVAGLSIAGGLRRGRVPLTWSPLTAVLAALPVLQAVSMAWSGSPRLARDSALTTAIWVAGALWLATADAVERRRLVDATAVGAAVSGIVLIAQASGAPLLAVGAAGPTGRLVLTGLTGNPADLALAAVLLLPLVLSAPDDSSKAWFRRVLAVLLSAAAVVSQTITALVALTLVWGIWLIQRRSRRLWAAAAVTVVVVAAIGLATGLDERVRRQIRRVETGDWYFLLSARSDGWTAAGEMIRDRPLVGVGAANFTHAYYPSRIEWLDRTGSVGSRAELATHFRFAHCDPLQMTAELGVVGLLWLAALALAVIRILPRGNPLPALSLAAVLPLVLLHFPTHLAVGLIPICLMLAHLLSHGRETAVEPARWLRPVACVAVVVVVVVGLYWQLNRLVLDLWRGGLSHALASTETLDAERATRQAAAVEAQILPRIQGLGGARPWMWRMVGQARMIRGDGAAAEIAFRNAMTLWPHEEAEFGIGLALALQDRQLRDREARLDSRNLRGEAVVHLARVCRTNPALLDLIDDPDLRQAVTQIVDASRRPAPDR